LNYTYIVGSSRKMPPFNFNQTQWTPSPSPPPPSSSSLQPSTWSPWTPPPHPQDNTFNYYCNDICSTAMNGVCDDYTVNSFVNRPNSNANNYCSSGTDCTDCGPVAPLDFRPFDCSDGIDFSDSTVNSSGMPCYFPWKDSVHNLLWTTCGIPYQSSRQPNNNNNKQMYWCPTNPQATTWASCTPGKCSYQQRTVSPTAPIWSHSPTPPPHHQHSSPHPHSSPSSSNNNQQTLLIGGNIALISIAFILVFGIVIGILVHRRRKLYLQRQTVVRDEETGMEMEYQSMPAGSGLVVM
jgi:hypothetical protein